MRRDLGHIPPACVSLWRQRTGVSLKQIAEHTGVEAGNGGCAYARTVPLYPVLMPIVSVLLRLDPDSAERFYKVHAAGGGR
jgi:hypothetical protein